MYNSMNLNAVQAFFQFNFSEIRKNWYAVYSFFLKDVVLNYLDTIPKPGLETPNGIEIQKLLDNQINPSVAMHGGHISLIDVTDAVSYTHLRAHET